MNNITLNVCGQIFQVSYETIINIPYFKNMFEDCGMPNEIIYVNRPPHIFKHILGLALEPKYPYPLKYDFELDFFGIVYDKDKLYKECPVKPEKKDKCTGAPYSLGFVGASYKSSSNIYRCKQ